VTIVPESWARMDSIGTARAHAARSLLEAIEGSGTVGNEAAIHDRWREILTADPIIMPSGWYLPPPQGMSVLIGQPPSFARTAFTSIRAMEKWPRDDSELTNDSMLFAYCSPVNRATAMIGDFQLTLYAGDEASVRTHLTHCLQITLATAEYAAVGMELREVYEYAMASLQGAGLQNSARSTTDPSHERNIGHSLPWSDGIYDDRIWPAISENRTTEIADLISNARVFVTASQSQKIGNDFAFTVEPQITSPDGIFASYHIIVSFTGGTKRIFANFLDLFRAFGMTEYLPTELLGRLELGEGSTA
jgi:hypothetical protein